MHTHRIHKQFALLSILILIFVSSCDDPVQPDGSNLIVADSVWISMILDEEQWVPGDSSDRFLSLKFDPTKQRLTLIAWNVGVTGDNINRPKLELTIDSVSGAGEYNIRPQGRVNILFDNSGTIRSTYRGIDGVVVLTTFDTLVAHEIRGSISARLVEDVNSIDTLTVEGDFVATW